MPDVILREVWAAAIIVRGLSFCVGVKLRAPISWICWVLFSESTSLWLRYLDYSKNGPGYRGVWIWQQIIGILMLGIVVRQEAKPLAFFAPICTAAALIVGLRVGMTQHAPSLNVQLTMFWVGLAALALGLLSICAADGYPIEDWVLSLYLLLYAFMMIAGADFTSDPGLGRAWSVLEILAFLVWPITFLRKHKISLAKCQSSSD